MISGLRWVFDDHRDTMTPCPIHTENDHIIFLSSNFLGFMTHPGPRPPAVLQSSAQLNHKRLH